MGDREGDVIVAADANYHNGVAIANVHLWLDGEWFGAKGTAVRHPEDKENPEIGYLYAYGRALQAVGRKLERRAEGLAKHQDDIEEIDQIENIRRTLRAALHGVRT